MNKTELERLLPHRPPMLLLDEAWPEEETARARVTVQGNEWFLQGHFPGQPVTPGVILCEMLAQSACVLLAEQAAGCLVFLTGLDQVRFRRPLLPGETLDISCWLTKSKPPFFFAKGEGRVAGDLCVSAEFSFMLRTAEGGA